MLRANKKTLILTSIITVLPVLIGIAFWNRLPDPMATHFVHLFFPAAHFERTLRRNELQRADDPGTLS